MAAAVSATSETGSTAGRATPPARCAANMAAYGSEPRSPALCRSPDDVSTRTSQAASPSGQRRELLAVVARQLLFKPGDPRGARVVVCRARWITLAPTSRDIPLPIVGRFEPCDFKTGPQIPDHLVQRSWPMPGVD